MVRLARHYSFGVAVFIDTSTGSHFGPPSASFLRGAPPPSAVRHLTRANLAIDSCHVT